MADKEKDYRNFVHSISMCIKIPVINCKPQIFFSLKKVFFRVRTICSCCSTWVSK